MNVMVSLQSQLFMRELRLGRNAQTVAALRELEGMGFWGISVVDHILRSTTDVPEHREKSDFNWRFGDPFSSLAYFAAMTTSLALAVRVLVIPYRSPFEVANAVATVDSLSGGRMILAAAAGYDRDEFRRLGVDRTQRGAMTDEYLGIIDRLLRGETVDHAGRFVTVEGARIQMDPVQSPRPPIWIGGNSRAAFDRAVRLGDAWTPILNPIRWPSASDGVDIKRAELVDLAHEARETRTALSMAPLELVAGADVGVSFSASPMHPGRRSHQIENLTLAGTPEEIVEEALAFREAGFSKIVIELPHRSFSAFLAAAEIFATDVLPHLKSAATGDAHPRMDR